MSPAGTRIAPWLAVPNGAAALRFYKEALAAEVVEQLDGDGGTIVVAQLSVDGAPLWIQEDPAQNQTAAAPVRLIVYVDDPDTWFARAVAAGAKQVAAMHESRGWRTGRVSDPFGYDWEFSKQLSK